MKTLKRILLNIGIGIVMVFALLVWIVAPWPFAVVVVLVTALWLAMTRSGRMAWAVTQGAIASLPQRWGASSVIVVGIGGVVSVLVAMLAMSEGFESTLEQAGRQDVAIILRGGSQTETNSILTRDQVPLVGQLPGIAKDLEGRPEISAELSQVVNLPARKTGEDANVQFRGISPAAWDIRPNIELIEGRRFQPGVREVIVGQSVQKQFAGLEVGNTVMLGNQEWDVVGVFASGDVHDSEMWTESETLASAYQRGDYQSILVKLDGKDGLKALKAAIKDDPRLQLDAQTTRNYFAKQSENLTKVISVLGIVIGLIMAVGAIFGALNTMYSAVAGRAREIATMRAIGFGEFSIVTAVMLETMLLAFIGGVLGSAIAWAAFNGYTASTLGANFSQVVFEFQVTPNLMWSAMKWAFGIGLIGGLFPALRAARLPVTDVIRMA